MPQAADLSARGSKDGQALQISGGVKTWVCEGENNLDKLVIDSDVRQWQEFDYHPIKSDAFRKHDKLKKDMNVLFLVKMLSAADVCTAKIILKGRSSTLYQQTVNRLHPLIRVRVVGAAASAEKPRQPSPQRLPPALLGESRGVPRPAERYNPLVLSIKCLKIV